MFGVFFVLFWGYLCIFFRGKGLFLYILGGGGGGLVFFGAKKGGGAILNFLGGFLSFFGGIFGFR
jgi:hypothetical protein